MTENESAAAPSYQFDFSSLGIGLGDDDDSQNSFFSFGDGDSIRSDGQLIPTNEISRLIVDNDWEEVMLSMILNKKSSLISTPEKDGMLPLHFACQKGAPADVIQRLVDFHPSAVSMQVENTGWTPLHFLAGGRREDRCRTINMKHELLDESENDSPKCSADCMVCKDTCNRVNAVQILLSSSQSTTPSAMVQTVDYDGGLYPLHVACLAEAEPGLIYSILDLDDTTVLRTDDDGNLPLHWMFHPRVSNELVKRMVSHYPNATQTRNSNHELPLHKACLHGAPSEVITFLLSEYPHGAQEVDNENGNLPLHLIIPKFSRLDEKSNRSMTSSLNESLTLQARIESMHELLRVYPDGSKEEQSRRDATLSRCFRGGAIGYCAIFA